MSRRIPPEAFEYYASLGPARSYEAVAEKYSVAKRSVTRHAHEDGWQERLRSIEAKARVASDQKVQETLEAIRTRHLRGLRFIQGKAIETLKAGSLESSGEAARAFTAAIREERVILGEPSDRTAISIDDVIKREYERWMPKESTEEESTDLERKEIDHGSE